LSIFGFYEFFRKKQPKTKRIFYAFCLGFKGCRGAIPYNEYLCFSLLLFFVIINNVAILDKRDFFKNLLKTFLVNLNLANYYRTETLLN